MDQDGNCTEMGHSPGDLCQLETYHLTKSGGTPPQFSSHFYSGETAGCIKMPLGVEVGLSPADFVLDWDPARPLQIYESFMVDIISTIFIMLHRDLSRKIFFAVLDVWLGS